jgi:hypothetical protein
MADKQAGQSGSDSDVWGDGGFPTKPVVKLFRTRKLAELLSRRSAKRQSIKRKAGA